MLLFSVLVSCNSGNDRLILLIDSNLYKDTTRFVVWIENKEVFNSNVTRSDVDHWFFTKEIDRIKPSDSLKVKIIVPQYGLLKDTLLKYTPEERVLSIYLTRELTGTINVKDGSYNDSAINHSLSAGFISGKFLKNPF